MPFTEKFDQGNCTSRDKADLRPGEMRATTGLYYKSGDNSRLHKLLDRSEFGDTSTSAEVAGLALLQFDSAADKLVALSDTALYGATPGTTGTFSDLTTATLGALDSSATDLSAAHYNDRWYLANGYDRPWVHEGDGTVRYMGMDSPAEQPSASNGSGGAGTTWEPGADDGTFSDAANAHDADDDTYAFARLASPGSTVTVYDTFTADVSAGRIVMVRWGLSGGQLIDDLISTKFGDVGGAVDAGYSVTIKIEYSEDSGSTWTELRNMTRTNGTLPIEEQSDALTADNDVVSVRATLTYVAGTRPATLRIYSVRIQEGGLVADFSTSLGGIQYYYTEYDETRDLESPASSPLTVDFSTENRTTLTLPGSADKVNTNATHYKIYKTVDGGTTFGRAGYKEIVATTTWTDFFNEYGKDDQPTELYPQLTVSVDGSNLNFDRNPAPPKLSKIRAFRGSLVGLSRENKRSLYYSLPGYPESWPEIYVYKAFPLEEHDELVDCLELGGWMIIWAKGAVMRVQSFARVVQGTFDVSEVEQIRSAPGAVGPKAVASFSVSGEARAAWISPQGLYLTNGQTVQRFSEDMDWGALEAMDKSNWALHWDKRKQVLIFAYSSTDGGANNRYALFHMSQGKANGLPKWTGPHTGNLHVMASGQVANNERVYSADASSGKVYLEDNGSAVASTLTSRRIYGDGLEFSALDATLRHTDFGRKTATVTWTVGSDQIEEGSYSTSAGVSLYQQRGTQFDVSLSGEWHEYSIEQAAGDDGAFLDMRINARGLGRAGTVKTA